MASTERILIVDDNVDAADLTAEVLRMNGSCLQVAYGGQEGLATALATRSDVVFPDIGMPLMNGYEVAKALRREAASQPLVIVALTAWGNEQSRQKSKAAGFDLHLTKPARFEELIKISQ